MIMKSDAVQKPAIVKQASPISRTVNRLFFNRIDKENYNGLAPGIVSVEARRSETSMV